MKKQITFYEKYCLDDALEYLEHLKECFKVKRVKITCYKSKRKGFWDGSEKRCRLEVSYE